MSTISRLKTIQRQLRLPARGEVFVSAQERVEAGQVVARATQYERVQVLDVGAALGVRGDMLLEYLLVGVGDPLERGEVIARRGGGLFGRKYKSPVAGRVSTILSGRIVVEADPRTVEVAACLAGRVIQVIPGYGAVIESEARVVEGAWGTGGETQGPIKVLAEGNDDALTADRIDANAQGCLLVGGLLSEQAALKKAVSQKARGMIVGSAPSTLLSELKRLPFPIMLTEGFGTIPMAAPFLEAIREAEGQSACLSASEETRDPVSRPQLILPGRAGGKLSQSGRQVGEGSTVRIVREPHMGKVGQIKRLHLSPRALESGTPQAVAEVETGRGEVVVVPLRNLEPID